MTKEDEVAKAIVDAAESRLEILKRLESGEKVPGFKLCPVCGGSGWSSTGSSFCKKCSGNGFVTENGKKVI